VADVGGLGIGRFDPFAALVAVKIRIFPIWVGCGQPVHIVALISTGGAEYVIVAVEIILGIAPYRRVFG